MKVVLAILLLIALLSGCTGSETPAATPAAGSADGDAADEVPASSGSTKAPTSSGAPKPGSNPAPGQAPGAQPNATANATEHRPWSLDRDGWASLDSALLRPGSRMENAKGGGCTVNFLFTDAASSTLAYIGTAAHCYGTGTNEEDVDTVDCTDTYEPMTPQSTTVSVPLYDPMSGPIATPPTPTVVGHFVYSSFVAMEAAQEEDADWCAYNDFALIQLDENATRLANPAVWHWGGPTGIRDGPTAAGEHLFTFGGTAFRNYPSGATRPRDGFVLMGAAPVAPELSFFIGVPGGCIGGDSGSPLTDEDGLAVAVVTRSAGGSGPVCVGAYLQPMLDYMAAHGGPDVVLATA